VEDIELTAAAVKAVPLRRNSTTDAVVAYFQQLGQLATRHHERGSTVDAFVADAFRIEDDALTAAFISFSKAWGVGKFLKELFAKP
jgi:hypothetical protein